MLTYQTDKVEYIKTKINNQTTLWNNKNIIGQQKNNHFQQGQIESCSHQTQ